MCNEEEVTLLLQRHGVTPTPQRLLISCALFSRRAHLSAEDVFQLVNAEGRRQVSKATVYNTLGLLACRGVVREVIAEAGRTFYDPNTKPHHHFYDESTGELCDIDERDLQVSKLPPLPAGAELQGVDVIVRVKRRAKV